MCLFPPYPIPPPPRPIPGCFAVKVHHAEEEVDLLAVEAKLGTSNAFLKLRDVQRTTPVNICLLEDFKDGSLKLLAIHAKGGPRA